MSNEIKKATVQGIKYNGNVTLKWVKDNKVIKTKQIKNSPTSLLLRGISSFLLDYPTTNLIPRYLDVGKNNSTNESTFNMVKLKETILNSRIILYRYAPQSIGESYTARFYTSIPSTATVPGQEIKEIGLFGTASGDSLLARIIITDEEISENGSVTIPDGTVLFVEWDISISGV